MLKSASGSLREVGDAGAERGDDVDRDAEPFEQLPHFDNIVAMAKAERGRPQNVAHLAGRAHRGDARWGRGEGAHQPVKRFRRAPVLFLLVGRQFKRHDRNVEIKRSGQTAGIVLDQLGRA